MPPKTGMVHRPGTSLVPPPGLKKEDIGFAVTPPDGEGTIVDTPSTSPPAPEQQPMPQLELFMQPQVASVHVGDSASMQLGLAGLRGSYRLRVGISWDPKRASLDGILYPPGVVEMKRGGDPKEGWLQLDLAITHSDESNQLLATLGFRATAAGLCPIAIDSGGALDEQENPVNMKAASASLYIIGEPAKNEDGS
jgi:hypothetical protein